MRYCYLMKKTYYMDNTTTIGWLKNHLTDEECTLVVAELQAKAEALFERRQALLRLGTQPAPYLRQKEDALDAIILKLKS
jgi:hypothetical protein